jgi:hypothetical protein
MYSDSEASDDNIPLAVVRGIQKKKKKIAGALNQGDISNIFTGIDSGSDSEFPSSDDESATPIANGRAMHRPAPSAQGGVQGPATGIRNTGIRNFYGRRNDHAQVPVSDNSDSDNDIGHGGMDMDNGMNGFVDVHDSGTNGAGVSDFTPSEADEDTDHSDGDDDSDDADDQPPINQAPARRGRGRPRVGARPRQPSPPPRVWSATLTDRVPKRFTGPVPGPTGDFSDLGILETFQLYFTDDFLDEIVRLTNKNYETKKRLEPRKNRMTMDPLTRDELKSWFGVIISMGLLQLKGDIRKYWSQKHKITRTDGFAEIFPVNRFLIILRYMHFVDEETALDRDNPQYDKFYKIRYLFTYLVPKWRELYNPTRNFAVDESMIKGQGRMPARQFMKNKPARWGLKNWALAESESGYVLNAELYGGKPARGRDVNNTPGEVVKRLVQPYEGQGRTVFMDNLFSGIELYEHLYRRGFMACGTLRQNRKNIPKDIVGKKKRLVKNLNRGQSLWRQSEEIYVVTWKDTKAVSILSTVPVQMETTPVVRMVKQNGQWNQVEFPRPTVIGLYNTNMGGVDLADKKVVCYKRQTKSLTWYHKVLWYMMDICILNSFILYNASRQPVSQILLRELRAQLSTELVGGRSYRKASPIVGQDDEQRKDRTVMHAPFKMPKAVNCRVHLQRVGTSYTCGVCRIRMCPYPCFQRYHYMDDYQFDDPALEGKAKIRQKVRQFRH